MPVAAPLDVDDKRARLAALKETLTRKGLLVELPEVAPAGPAPLATGWPEVDALLGGGFPRRVITEVLGTASCGKTSLAAAALGALTRAGSLAAWIDAAGEIHPPALAAAGVDLSRLLIVRPGKGEAGDATAALWAAEVLLQSGTFDAVVLDATSLPAPPRRALDRRAPVLRGAAEANDAALVVLAADPFGLPVGLRLRVAPMSGARVHVVVEKTRAGTPGGATPATLPPLPVPPPAVPPPLLARAVKSRTGSRRR